MKKKSDIPFLIANIFALACFIIGLFFENTYLLVFVAFGGIILTITTSTYIYVLKILKIKKKNE